MENEFPKCKAAGCDKLALADYDYCPPCLAYERRVALNNLEDAFNAQREAWQRWRELNK